MTDETTEGTMHRPTYRNEWNVNTYIMIVGFMAGLVAWGATWGSFRSDVNAMDGRFKREIERIDDRSKTRGEANEARWKDHLDKDEARWKDHDQLHRDRAADNAALMQRQEVTTAAALAALQTRVVATEADLRKLENLEWRVSKVEDTQQSLTKAVEDIRAFLNDLVSDQKIMREILQRLDQERTPPTVRQPPLLRRP